MVPKHWLVGVEIGATKLQAVLGRPDGQIKLIVREQADKSGGAKAILQQVRQMIEMLLGKAEATAIGIGFGGPIDYDRGRVIKSHQVTGWDDRPLAAWAQEIFGLPCRVANDTDTATLAEATIGSGRDRACVFYTNLGSGIGGGLVKNGRLYMGHRGAMEFGHIWSYSPLLGRWEYLEQLCSGWTVARRAREMVGAQKNSMMLELSDGQPEQIDAPMVVEAWRRGDKTAGRLMDDVIDSYSRALCSVVALLNPDIIIIGGGMALVGKPLFQALEKAVRKYVYKPFANNFSIAPATLGEQSVPIGALLLAGDTKMNSPGITLT